MFKNFVEKLKKKSNQKKFQNKMFFVLPDLPQEKKSSVFGA
jgi:hypothetical protein